MLQLYHNFKNIEEKVIKLFFVNKLFIDETSLAELNYHMCQINKKYFIRDVFNIRRSMYKLYKFCKLYVWVAPDVVFVIKLNK